MSKTEILLAFTEKKSGILTTVTPYKEVKKASVFLS